MVNTEVACVCVSSCELLPPSLRPSSLPPTTTHTHTGEVLQEVRREFVLQRGKQAPYDIKYALSDGRTKLKMLEETIGFTR